ncbi:MULTISPECIES: hypothetical protein [Halobacterium]|uniref:hypothetical protein n=1 Tax=Halobacterium TaxID=2239 RepID=UPI00196275FD|nr:hypothetical protein [Halobacterium sp. BOL4-2]QRY26373.1 hypothetical protein JRZ79_13060 [Halobacterium sp. BOL4-2]
MGYTHNCDGPCGNRYDRPPAFMGEFRESFLKTTASPLTQMFEPGETATFCRDCMELVVASGIVAVCRRCGFAQNNQDLPGYMEDCPRCEDGELDYRPIDEDR